MNKSKLMLSLGFLSAGLGLIALGFCAHSAAVLIQCHAMTLFQWDDTLAVGIAGLVGINSGIAHINTKHHNQ